MFSLSFSVTDMPQNHQIGRRRTILGYLSSVFVLVGFCASSAAAQALQTKIPDFQLCCIRFTAQFILSVTILRFIKGDSDWLYSNLTKLISIAGTGMVYTVFFFHGVAILPLVDSYAFFSLVANVALALATRFYLHSDLGLFHHISISLGTLGCFLIVQPWKQFSVGFVPGFMQDKFNSSQSDIQIKAFSNLSDSEFMHSGEYFNVGLIVGFGYLLILLAGLNEAVSLMLVGMLQSVNPLVLTAFTSALCLLASILMSFYLETPVLITDLTTIGFATLHAIGASVGSIGMSFACMYIAPSRVSLVQSFNIIIVLFLQYTVLRNGLFGRMNAAEVIGTLTVCFSIILSIISSLNEVNHIDFSDKS